LNIAIEILEEQRAQSVDIESFHVEIELDIEQNSINSPSLSNNSYRMFGDFILKCTTGG